MSSSAVSILSGGAAVTQPRGSRGRGRSLPAGAEKEGGGGGRREWSRARAGARAQVRERKREEGERGRHSQPQVLLVLGAAVSPGRSGLVVPSHRSQTPGWGREEAGAAASHT